MPQYSKEGLIVQPVDAFSRQHDDIDAVVDGGAVPEKLPAKALDSVTLDRLSYMFFCNHDAQSIVLQVIAVSQKQNIRIRRSGLGRVEDPGKVSGGEQPLIAREEKAAHEPPVIRRRVACDPWRDAC